MKSLPQSPLTFIVTLLLLSACSCMRSTAEPAHASSRSPVHPVVALEEGQADAVFAGGCFWCMEAPFDQLEGVVSTTSGYTGGTLEHPTYEEVSSGRTDHVEAIRIIYDPERVSYATLLDTYWENIDPTDIRGQFCDRGAHYAPAIFVQNDEERAQAQASQNRAEARLRARGIQDEIVAPILDASRFFGAEAYHQDFYQRNPRRYYQYRRGCGRDDRLSALWGEGDH